VAKAFKNLRYQQVELRYRSTRLAIIATVIGAAILVSVAWLFIDHALVVAWLVTMLLIMSVRGVLSYRFFNRLREETVVPLWAKYYSVGSDFAAGWGIATIILFPDGDFTYQTFLAFIIVGLAVAAITSLAIIFLTLVLAPLGITLLITEDTLRMTMGVLILVFYGFLLGNARRISNNTIAMIHAREKADEVLYHAKERARNNFPVWRPDLVRIRSF